MAFRRKSKADHIVDIRRLAQNPGWTPQRIADKLKLSVRTIYSYVWEGDITISRAPNPYHDASKAKRKEIVALALAEPGLTRHAIAVRCETSGATVHRALKAAGLPTVRQYDASGKLIDRPVVEA